MTDNANSVPDRRALLRGLAAAGLAGAMASPGQVAAQALSANALATMPAILATSYAAGDGRPAGAAVQAALDASYAAGLPLLFPRGDWLIDQPLVIRHDGGQRRGFPQIIGAGVGSTRWLGRGFQGPMLSVLGVPETGTGSWFLSGGGIDGIEMVGSGLDCGQEGLAVAGWQFGTLRNCAFHGFASHGLRSFRRNGHPNPDWGASSLKVETCLFERLGGWGYLDDNPIGSPAFVFDRCLFNYCGAGGAFVRSSGCQFLGCSFAGAGFVGENRPGRAATGVGLRLGDGDTTINRTRVVVAEFDSNRDVHLIIDRSTSCLIEDARFIFNDRNGLGRMTPRTAIQFGTAGNPRSLLQNIRIVRPLVRIDHPGDVIAFDLQSAGQDAGVSITDDSVFQPADGAGSFQRLRGFAPH